MVGNNYLPKFVLKLNIKKMYQTGYFANTTSSTKVHVVDSDLKPICGSVIKGKKFQWNAHDVFLPYVECERCKKKLLETKSKTDLFGNKKPVMIEGDEWWFNGRIIQRQRDSRLPDFISFNDGEESYLIETHKNMDEAIKYALKNPCKNPKHLANDYI